MWCLVVLTSIGRLVENLEMDPPTSSQLLKKQKNNQTFDVLEAHVKSY